VGAFFRVALRIWWRPREALAELAGNDHSVWAATGFAAVVAAVCGGMAATLGAGDLTPSHRVATAVGVAVLVTLAPWAYGVLLWLCSRLLGSPSSTLGGAVRISAAFTGAMPAVLLWLHAAFRIGPAVGASIGVFGPILVLIGYSSFVTLTVFETHRDATWLGFSALGVAALCWGTCAANLSAHQADLVSAPVPVPTRPSLVLPAPPPVRAPPPAAVAVVDAGGAVPAPVWAVRVRSVPPGAAVHLATGQFVGHAPVDVRAPPGAESIHLRVVLGSAEKQVVATRDLEELLVTLPPPATLRFDGLYRTERGRRAEWLRFYSDGSVVATQTGRQGSAREASRELDHERARVKGRYEFDGTKLSFTLTAKRTVTHYAGTLEHDHLSVSAKSEKTESRYTFVAP
jgi:hypothetical protein